MEFQAAQTHATLPCSPATRRSNGTTVPAPTRGDSVTHNTPHMTSSAALHLDLRHATEARGCSWPRHGARDTRLSDTAYVYRCYRQHPGLQLLIMRTASASVPLGRRRKRKGAPGARRDEHVALTPRHSTRRALQAGSCGLPGRRAATRPVPPRRGTTQLRSAVSKAARSLSSHGFT